jgi:hypothetical protein
MIPLPKFLDPDEDPDSGTKSPQDSNEAKPEAEREEAKSSDAKPEAKLDEAQPEAISDEDEPDGSKLGTPKSSETQSKEIDLDIAEPSETKSKHLAYMPTYKADGGRPAKFEIQDTSLHVSGAVVDVITKVWDECWGDFNWDPTVIQSWYPENPTDLYLFTGETLGQAFSHIINADYGSVISSDGGERGFHKHWHFINQNPRYLDPKMKSLRDIMLFWMRSAVVGRRFFETSWGYIGLVPNASQVGDEVCLFYGSQVFHVVRKNEYIGEAYVHGLMDGEALDLPIVETDFKLV